MQDLAKVVQETFCFSSSVRLVARSPYLVHKLNRGKQGAEFVRSAEDSEFYGVEIEQIDTRVSATCLSLS